MVTYGEQSGDSIENAITITGAKDENEGVKSEYIYIEKKYGPWDETWKRKNQAIIAKDTKRYDRIQIVLNDGSEKEFYFDITDFWGKGLEGVEQDAEELKKKYNIT